MTKMITLELLKSCLKSEVTFNIFGSCFFNGNRLLKRLLQAVFDRFRDRYIKVQEIKTETHNLRHLSKQGATRNDIGGHLWYQVTCDRSI